MSYSGAGLGLGRTQVLMNLSTHPLDLERFGSTADDLRAFLAEQGLSGVEAISYDGDWQAERLPKDCIQGYHMPFWPLWLPFWRGDQEWIAANFESEATLMAYYGGKEAVALVEQYRQHFELAMEMGAAYAVIHVSHCDLESCYSYQFDIEPQTVVQALIELVNLALEQVELPKDFWILFENQWWPGLDFKDHHTMQMLLDQIHHEATGFVLDTGHFMNSHLDLQDETEALVLLNQWWEGLGALKDKVLAVHLSSSLSGNYVKETMAAFAEGRLSEQIALDPTATFFERYFGSFAHIGQIDQHRVFETVGMAAFIERLDPRWLVFEFMTGTKKEADQMIGRQWAALKG